MQRLLFEYSPFWILGCGLAGIVYATLLYQKRAAWSVTTNRLLFIFRSLAVTLLCLLLIGPILKLTFNQEEKPSLVLMMDNSLSIKEVLDSAQRMEIVKDLEQQKNALEEKGYAVEVRDLNGNSSIHFNEGTSDLQSSIRKVVADYEGKNLAGIALVSDGIYNSGTSPLYTALRVPVYTIGVGDTSERVDLVLKNIAYNKIAYQGNKFPLHAEVILKGTSNENIQLQIYQGNKLLVSEEKKSGSQPLVSFDFLLDATATGLQRFDLLVQPVSREFNIKNNRTSVFIEVVEGKKKIMIASPAPHPDIKALRAAIEKNANYEVILHIPGVEEAASEFLTPERIDLAIFLRILTPDGKNNALVQRFLKSKTGVLLALSNKSNLRQLEANSIPLAFENPTQKDDVTPLINSTFRDFAFADQVPGTLSEFPPMSVPFGKYTFPTDAQILLYQKIGSVPTTRPLLLSWQRENQKLAVLLGEGIWKWRLHEFAQQGSTSAFDEVFSKLVQYLSTQEDKRKFRSFPLASSFHEAEPVIFESQVYNELFEPVYGNTIQLDIENEKGEIIPFSYTLSPGNTRYRIGSLQEGVYRYRASTELQGKREEVRGEFLIAQQNLESQNLTADFGLLRKLSTATGGEYFDYANRNELLAAISKKEAKSVLHSEDSFHPLINLKAVFFLVLLLVSAEWLTRKYLGAY